MVLELSLKVRRICGSPRHAQELGQEAQSGDLEYLHYNHVIYIITVHVITLPDRYLSGSTDDFEFLGEDKLRSYVCELSHPPGSDPYVSTG